MKQQFFSSLFPITISMVLLIVTLWMSVTGVFERTSQGFNDIFTHKLQYSHNMHQDDIVIVKIDDATLDTLPQSDIWMLAFDKGLYARVIETLFEEYDIAALWIDIVFANPSILWKEDEEALREVLERYKERVVIATRSDGDPHPLCLYAEALHGAIDTAVSERVRWFKLDYAYHLSEYCPGYPLHTENTERIQGLAYRTLMLGIPYLNPLRAQEIQLQLELWRERSEEIFISYYTNGRDNLGTLGFKSYSLKDILEGKSIDLERKIVLLGEVWTLLHDSQFTPIHSDIKMPGVEIHANMLQTLLDGRNIQMITFFAHLIVLLWLSWICIFVIFRYSLWIALGTLFMLASMILLWWASLFLFDRILDIFLLLLYIFLLFPTLYMYRYTVVDRAKRKLKKQFSLYVSPDVVEDISRNPDSVILEGEERELSIFFSDIVWFTSISESLSPRELLELLNEYFSEMTRIIQEQKGTIDKFIGDAVMCFFNAPLLLENHSFHACRTALLQQKKLKELRKKWKHEGKKELDIRIGLHTGSAIHGNIWSSEKHVNYTIIGDSVNLASRLEGICKEYGIHICCSQSIYELQKENFHFRELDVIRVKGKQQAVKIYELLGSKEFELPVSAQDIFWNYALWLQAYRSWDFPEAKKIWLQSPQDTASRMMAERCDTLISWEAQLYDGVFVMTHK